MAYRKIIALFSVLCFLISAAGCETLNRKFIPKKKEVAQKAVMQQEKEYIKEPNEELYKKHFLFWKSWQGELADSLGSGNHLKEISCAESAALELDIVKSYLTEAKQKELEPELKELNALRDKIKEGELTQGLAMRLSNDAERLKRRIEKKFSYIKVKEYIK